MAKRPTKRIPHYVKLIDALKKHPEEEMSQRELSTALSLDKNQTRRASVYAEKKGLVRVIRSKSLALRHIDGNVLLKGKFKSMNHSVQSQSRHQALKNIYQDRHRGY